VRWQVPCAASGALIMAGDCLYAGAAGSVAAYRVSDGTEVWRAEVEGVVKGLAAAHGHLLVSTDASRIYCFAPHQ